MPEHSTGPSSLRWLADDGRFWRVCTVIFGLFAICKGLRMPLSWALTQAQIDYTHGLIKRGLLGTLYGALGLHHLVPLSIAFFVELTAFFLLLAAFARQSGITNRFGTYAVLAVFASSYAVTYLTQLVGYSDIPLGILALVLLTIRSPDRRFWFGLGIVPAAMLIHESFLLLFLPVVLFSFYLDALTGSAARLRRRYLLQAGVLALLALAVAFTVSLRSNLAPGTVAQFQDEIAARVDFPLNHEVMLTLSRSLSANVHDVLVVMKQEQWWSKFLASACALLPLLLLTFRWLRRLVDAVEAEHGIGPSPHVFAAALLSCLLPLLMYGLGWDCARWNVLCLLAGFLTLSLLSRKLQGRMFPLSAFDRNAIVLLLAINMASGFGFFERFQMHPYPFFPALMHTSR